MNILLTVFKVIAGLLALFAWGILFSIAYLHVGK